MENLVLNIISVCVKPEVQKPEVTCRHVTRVRGHVSSKWHANPNIWVLKLDATMDLNTMNRVPGSYFFISASPPLASGTGLGQIDFEVDLYIFVNTRPSTIILCKVLTSTSTF